MERLERRSKKDQDKKEKRVRTFVELITGNNNNNNNNSNNNNGVKKEIVTANDNNNNNNNDMPMSIGSPIPSPRGVFEVPISDSDSTGSENYGNSQRAQQGGKLSPSAAGGGDGHQWRNMIDALRFKSVRRFSTIPLLAASYESSRRSLRNKLARARTGNDDENDFDGALDLEGITKPSWRNFSYEDLAAATDNFNPENMIGKGGHAEVYKARLPDGQVVAVKRLMRNEKEAGDKAGDFLSELGIIAHINHPNATRLIGFGIDRGLYFVLQFASHGSLSSMLFGSDCLEWKRRFKVAVGVAKGLQYLHQDCPRRIIHRDIKASNILLNHNDEAEISDFGLAKWLPDKWAHHVVFPIEGTFGYLAPEYFMHGLVDEKTDVFAFGVLLLELMTGRRAVDSNSRQSLVIWAKPLLDAKQVQEIADPRLEEQYDPIEMKIAMATASMCVHHMSSKRPYMNQVVLLLKGEEVAMDLTQKSIAPRSLLLDACDLEDYTCSNYLNDLNRHKQLIME
ncbi:receptor-like cytosolic serine/threonine-protein kinase RBK1 [Vicia villosa]|uniref:receptor-like cytosolic serine/threonine-protein kinase RBK1 n=1 Tax=Vicia villosa TaxID=3911 RepID=UPI00273C8444|nr:receptor-like cytosolic serine/threonine-protein kinase RBK1 [Vicia villosa]